MFVILDDGETAVNLAHVTHVDKRDDRSAVIYFCSDRPPLAIIGEAAVRDLFRQLAAVASPAPMETLS